MGNTIIIIIFLAVFAGVFVYLIVSKIKRRGENWTGTVIDKNVTETASTPAGDSSSQSGFGITLGGSRSAINRDYSLRIKDDTGKEFSWPVGEGFYASVQVGDRLSKQPGTEVPTKISAVNQIQPPQASQPPQPPQPQS